MPRTINIKHIIRSRTFQLAVVQGVLGVVIVLITEFPEAGGLLLVKSVLDIFLRANTSVPVRLK